MNIKEIYENDSDEHVDLDNFINDYPATINLDPLEENEEGRIRFYETGINFHDD